MKDSYMYDLQNELRDLEPEKYDRVEKSPRDKTLEEILKRIDDSSADQRKAYTVNLWVLAFTVLGVLIGIAALILSIIK